MTLFWKGFEFLLGIVAAMCMLGLGVCLTAATYVWFRQFFEWAVEIYRGPLPGIRRKLESPSVRPGVVLIFPKVETYRRAKIENNPVQHEARKSQHTSSF